MFKNQREKEMKKRGMYFYYQLNNSLICFLLTAERARATSDTRSNDSSTSAPCNSEERPVSDDLENEDNERDPEDDSEAEFNEDDLIDTE